MSRWIGPSPEHDHIGDVLDAADAWRDRCFTTDGSLFGEEALWTIANIQVLKELTSRIVDSPIKSEDFSFPGQLKDQLMSAPSEVIRLAAEVVWLLFLCPWHRSVAPETKREKIQEIWEWSGSNLPENKLLDDRVLLGVEHTGAADKAQAGAIADVAPRLLTHDAPEVTGGADADPQIGPPKENLLRVIDSMGQHPGQGLRIKRWHLYQKGLSLLQCKELRGLDHKDVPWWEERNLVVLRPPTPEERRAAMARWETERIANVNSYQELDRLLQTVILWKTEPPSRQIVWVEESSFWRFVEWLDQIEGANQHPIRHVLLYFLFPGYLDRFGRLWQPGSSLKEPTDTPVSPQPVDKGEPDPRSDPAARQSLNRILYGPPGTGKTYATTRCCVEVCDGAAKGSDKEIRSRYQALVESGRIEFITFHH